jgi:hypothetical protein
MKTEPHTVDQAARPDAAHHEIVREILRALQSVQYGSVEVIIHNSKVVQIERKEKFRFDKPADFEKKARE